MEANKPVWLEHLEGVVPARGYGNRMSMYLIALEAWRRGLKVKFHKIDNPNNKMYIRYTISDGTNEHKFESSRGDKLTSSAYEVCENKDVTKSVLYEAGVPVPQGRRFAPKTDKQVIIDYAKRIKFPVVVKPVAENAGKGVFPNISTVEELENTLDHVRGELGYEDILVEKHFYGTEYRILIVDGKIVGAVNRLPANIIGNGENTIDELIRKKNKEKNNNPIISTKLIEKDREVLSNLASYGYTLESVPLKNERIYLRNKSNVSRGGDPIDVTDELTEDMKEIALKSVHAIDGLDICGLDMLVNEEDHTCAVLEINTKPMIGLHMYPIKGKARDVVSPIIDYYFPKTKEVERSNLYFEFTAALAPIRNYVTKEIHITPISSIQNEVAIHFIISGDNLNKIIGEKIRLKALELRLNGFFEVKKRSEEIHIVVATEDHTSLTEFENFIQNQIPKYSNTNIQKLNWTKPVNLGFLILRGSGSKTTSQRLRSERKKLRQEVKQKKKRLANAERKLKKLKSEIEEKNNSIIRLDVEKQELKEEMKLLSNELDDIYNSRSWKLTQPLRRFKARGNKK